MEVAWCSICNSRPADGQLTVIIEKEPVDLDACLICVTDKEKVEFI